MKFFNNWILKQANKIYNTQPIEGKLARPIAEPTDDLESVESLHFRLVPANGGVIVSIRKYDRLKDRTFNSLHLITSEQDVATELAKIAAIELYKL